jgi:hypothetical protein
MAGTQGQPGQKASEILMNKTDMVMQACDTSYVEGYVGWCV